MQIHEGIRMMLSPARLAAALRAVALAAAVCMLAQAPVSANVGESTGGATGTVNPSASSHAQKAPAEPKAKVNSKSPYAAWRAQHEQAETPDTSGHGHRAPLPEGQSHPRRVPQ